MSSTTFSNKVKNKWFAVYCLASVLILSLPAYFLFFFAFDDKPYIRDEASYPKVSSAADSRSLLPITQLTPLSAPNGERTTTLLPKDDSLINVAVFVMDDNFKGADGFLNSSMRYFLTRSSKSTKPLSITYFVFYRNLEVFLQKRPSRFVVNILAYTVKGEYNPCRVYLQSSKNHHFFLDSQFDYVLSFDSRMLITKPVDVFSELLSDRIAPIHPSFQDFHDKSLYPFDRRKESCAYVPLGAEGSTYFSADIFGGRPSTTRKFCEAVTKCQYSFLDDWPPFHQVANWFYVDHPPTKILKQDFIYASSINNVPPAHAPVAFNDKMIDPYTIFDVMTYDAAFHAKREKRVQKLVQEIRFNYVNYVARKIPLNHKTLSEVIALSCSNESECSGFGAVRGAASIFYYSIASDRSFSLQWSLPTGNASQFFKTGAQFYGIHESYENLFSRPLALATNRTWTLLRPLFSNRTFYPALHQAIPSLPEYKSNIDWTEYVSAAMRIVFGNLTSEAGQLVDEVITGVAKTQDIWSSASKIGVQVRLCRPGEESCSRAKFHQLICYAEKVQEVIRVRLGQVPRLVFVTTDSGDASVTEEIRKLLEQLLTISGDDARVIVFDSIITSRSGKSAINETQRSFLDWYILTQMDWLVISHGHFGETASIFSLKPTEVYDHTIHSNHTCRFAWYNRDITETDKF